MFGTIELAPDLSLSPYLDIAIVRCKEIVFARCLFVKRRKESGPGLEGMVIVFRIVNALGIGGFCVFFRRHAKEATRAGAVIVSNQERHNVILGCH